MSLREWIYLLTLSILWGGSFFFVEIAVDALPPLTVVLLRVGLAAVALQLILRLLGIPLGRERRVWLAFFGMGLLNNAIPFSLLVWGQSHIASGLASILNATTPMFTLLVAQVATNDDKLTASRLGGVLLGFLGVAVMLGEQAVTALGSNLWAQIACLGAALSYGLAAVFGRRFRRMGLPPLQTAAGQVTASTAILLPLALWIDRPWSLPLPPAEAIASVAGLALASTAFAYILYFRILATAGATNLSLVTLLVPVTAILLGTSVLGEALTLAQAGGMLLIGLGLLVIDGRLTAHIRRAMG